MILNLVNKNKPEVFGIEICNAENHNTVGKVFKKIKDHVDNNVITKWTLIRDIHLPIKPSWIKSLDLIHDLSPVGSVLYIDQNISSKIVAYKEILDAVSTGDLQFNNQALNRTDIDQYFFKEVFSKIPLIFRIFSHIEIKDPLTKGVKSSQLGEEKIQSNEEILRNKLLMESDKRILVNVEKNIDNYLEHKEEYNKIIDTLANEKKILILLKNASQNQVIFTKHLEDSFF